MQWPRGPILRCKLNAPESGRRREKFQTDTLAFLTGIAEINDPAVLIFFSRGIAERYLRAQFDGSVQVNEPAVRVHHDGLTGFAELAAIGVPAARMHGKPGKHAGTATLLTGVQVRCFERGHECSLHDAQIAHKRQSRQASQRINSRKRAVKTCCRGLPFRRMAALSLGGGASCVLTLRSYKNSRKLKEH